MSTASAVARNFANSRGAQTCTTSTVFGSLNFQLAETIREIYSSKTAETLAVWLKCSLRTAKHRLASSREFTIEELETLLHSDHGFKILGTIMSRAKRKPSWWNVCEPLMDLADAELLVQAIRARTAAVQVQRETEADALETEIRRTQAMAIQGEGPARTQNHALQSIARAGGRLVAPKGRMK